MTDKHYNPFISDAVQAVHKATKSANKNLNNALEVAVDALSVIKKIAQTNAVWDTATTALESIAAILKVRQQD